MATRGYEQFIEDHWKQTTGEDVTAHKLTPYWPVHKQGDEAVLKWLEDTLGCLEDENQERAEKQLNYMRFYNAMEQFRVEGRSAVAVDQDRRPIKPEAFFVMNHARDFANAKVSRLMQYSPSINVLPWNNEYTDRLGARFSKRVIDNLFYVNKIADIFEEVVLEGTICGESFLFITYDPFTGDLSPEYQKMLEQNPKAKGVPQKFVDNAGREVDINLVKRVGDVDYEHPLPWLVLHEPRDRWSQVQYIYKGKIKHIDEVRAENRGMPGINPLVIPSSKDSAGYGSGFKYGEWVIEWEFYHKGHRFLDAGAYCKFIPGVLLEHEDNPYSHRSLPVARFTDYTDPMNAHGLSFFDDLKPPLVLYNKLMNLMYRNIAIGAHPKMMVPEGSCNIHSLANGPMVVEYQYPMKPELMTFQTIGGEVFNFSDKLMGDTTKMAGHFAMSRGDQVPNARARSILNFYEEQEEQHSSSQIKKYTSFIEKVAKFSLGVAGDFYEEDDGRTLRVLGRNNQYKIRSLSNVSKLSGPYDVRVERTTALAESKQGRIDQIQTLSTIPLASQSDVAKPGLFTREQILRMIEVADLPTFFEMATAAVERAESENEDLFEGLEVTPPNRWEAHLVDWNVHFQFMQSREFCDVTGVPDEIRKKFLEHFETHEYWMYHKAKVSLAFAQGLMENPYFPAVYKIGSNPTIAQLILIHQMPPPPPPPMAGAGPAPGEPGGLPAPEEGQPNSKDPLPEKDADQKDPMVPDVAVAGPEAQVAPQ